jgi:predicted dehydrogenase
MPESIPLAIVGCGGMGHRHMYGLAELQKAGLSPFELVGVCDPQSDNAESLAEQAEERLGTRPAVAASLDELPGGVAAIDLTTTPRFHHTVAVDAFERGWHVMSEKPLGLTARACKIMVDAAAKAGCVLSTAENYRRDPINRLGKALLDAGVIGDARLMLHHTMGGGDAMLISVWRHQKDASGVMLDVGVHFADILEYYLGPAATVYAQTRLHEKTRKNPAAGTDGEGGGPAGVYGRWQKEMPAEFDATADDAGYSTMLFESGAVVSYIEDHASRGEGMWKRAIFGSRGSMDLPGDRSGRRLTLHLPGQEPQTGAELLDHVPDFRLDAATAALFGGDRLYEYSFEFPETDRKLIAVEYADFGAAIQGEAGRPEVDGMQGARSVAIAYAWMESQVAGRVVTVDEVLNDEVNAYQAEINDSLGL